MEELYEKGGDADPRQTSKNDAFEIDYGKKENSKSVPSTQTAVTVK
jgi:hypothetical protein